MTVLRGVGASVQETGWTLDNSPIAVGRAGSRQESASPQTVARPSCSRIALAVLGLFLLAVPAQTERQPLKYAFLLTIDSTDSRNNVIGTIRGNGSLLDLIEGRDSETVGSDTWFNRYVLKPSLLPVGTPELPAIAFVGINAGVPAVVRNEYSQNSIFWRTVEFRGYTPAATRQFMQDYLRNLAWQNGATHYWQIVPGASLSGDLLSHFTPIN